MTDYADDAQRYEELDIEIALKNRGKPPRIVHHSHCLWCGEALPPKHGKFCDAECRKDFDRKFNTIK